MLALEDTIALPAGVRLERDAVVDTLRRARYPVNATATFVLARAGRPLGDVAAELSCTYRLEPERARQDVLAFSLHLNRCLLANIHRGGSAAGRVAALAMLALRLAPAGRVPAPLARRAPLDTSSPLRALYSAGAALRRRMVVLWLVGALLTVQLAVLATPSAGGAVVVLPTALALGVALHEAGHAAALAGVSAALVLAGPRTYVVHAPVGPARRRWVGAAGPALPAALGVLLVAGASRFAAVGAAVGGCVLAGHAAGLTNLTGDGRSACGL
jgi:hypothetical protein